MGKRIFVAVTAVLMTVSMAFGISACNSGDGHVHNWDDGVITREATCNSEGIITFTCLDEGCGETEEERIPMKEHNWDDGVITTEPTCHTLGVKMFTCQNDGCGQTKVESVAMTADHTWNEGVITTQPTCETAGVKTYTCTVDGCGQTKTEPVEKTDHSWNSGELVKIPDIFTGGEIKYTCTECGETASEPVEAHADFSEQFYTNILSETNWQYGYAQEFDAQTDGFTFVRIMQTDEEQPTVWAADGVQIGKGWISAQNNTAVAYKVRRNMSIGLYAGFIGDEEQTRVSAQIVLITAEGEVKQSALITADSKDWEYENEISDVSANDTLYLIFINEGEGAPGGSLTFTVKGLCVHSWNDGEITTEPDCNNYGEKTYTCENCGETRTEQVEKTAHSWNDGEITTEPDCNNYGEKTYTCEICGETRTEQIEKTAHNWVENDRQEPTTDADGYVEYVCDICNETRREVLPHTPHEASTELVKDGTGHWYYCTAHDNCNEQIDFEEHSFVQKHDGEGHYFECTVCGYTTKVEEHDWTETVITPPAFGVDGEKRLECACGESKTEIIPALTQTTSADGFNGNGNWQYGYSEYHFGDNEYFDFTALTDKNEGGDAFVAADTEIKAGWFMHPGGMFVTVAYTFTADVTTSVRVEFNGVPDGDPSRYALRTGITDSEGNLYNNPEYMNGTSFVYEKEITFKAGDTVYFIFNHEEAGWDQGNYYVTLSIVG